VASSLAAGVLVERVHVPLLSKRLVAVNGFAVRTPWLHAPMSDYARYGIALFVVLIAAGWWIARRRVDRPVLSQ
jgi:hypothetical protein